jgi:hypothetical protein
LDRDEYSNDDLQEYVRSNAAAAHAVSDCAKQKRTRTKRKCHDQKIRNDTCPIEPLDVG